MSKYIVILDYCTSIMWWRPLQESEQLDDDWFRSFGLKESQCSYMITYTEPELTRLYTDEAESAE